MYARLPAWWCGRCTCCRVGRCARADPLWSESGLGCFAGLMRNVEDRTHRGRAQVDRKVLDAGNDIRAQTRRCAQRPKHRDTSRELFEQDSEFEPSEACAQAEGRTRAAERPALVGVALDVEAERIREHVFISI